MPELPEVELGRKIAERTAAHRKIRRVVCADDPIVFEGAPREAFEAALLRREVRAVHRRGKYLWFELDRRPWPLFHFGMTGAFVRPNEAPLLLESSPKKLDTSWPPRFTKIHLFFDDGGELVMTNKRRLGRIRLLSDPPNEPPISKLGFDPHLDLPSLAQLKVLLARRSGAIKGVLLDQGFAAGVGNWIADEVLYQAGIAPTRTVGSLDAEEVKRLRAKLKLVIDTAVKVDADKTRFPRTWLFHHRWGKTADAVTARGEAIVHITVAGRTTAWVPSAQV